MTRLLMPAIAALVWAAAPSCKKAVEVQPFDNTAEREAFYERYNAGVAEAMAKRRAELEKERAGDLPDTSRADKQRELDDILRRLRMARRFTSISTTTRSGRTAAR